MKSGLGNHDYNRGSPPSEEYAVLGLLKWLPMNVGHPDQSMAPTLKDEWPSEDRDEGEHMGEHECMGEIEQREGVAEKGDILWDRELVREDVHSTLPVRFGVFSDCLISSE